MLAAGEGDDGLATERSEDNDCERGLMGNKYSDEQKAVVLAALLAGQSLNSVAKEYKISKATVSRWKNNPVPLNGTQKKEIGELLTEYLSANLETLRAQLVIFSDETWLRRSSSEGAAVLHGVLTDKAIRLLEAISKHEHDES